MPEGALLGTRLGKYELIERLAVGGMGEIFLARQAGAAGFVRTVVVKRLIPELAERPELVTLFIDEARIVAHLSHPNIVQIHEFGSEQGVYYLAMEYVPGQNLARIVERAEREGVVLARPLAAHVVAEVARGLDFAHRACDESGKPLGIVHRDVSPHNVMISRDGDVKLMDFGIAKAAIRQQRTETGVVRGKVAYMAPEQIEGREVDGRTDVYAAGILLWELTLRRRLYGGVNELETLRRAQGALVPWPHEIDPDYPEELETIVMGALARDPARRTQTAGELGTALRAWLGREGERVEKEQLGEWVTRLFPVRPPGSAESATQAVTAPRVSTEEVAAGSAPATPVEIPTRRSARAWMAGATAAVVAGLAAVVVANRVSTTTPSEPDEPPPAPRTAAQALPIPEPVGGPVVDAAVAPPLVTPEVPAVAREDRPPERRPGAGARRPGRGTPDRAEPAAAAAPPVLPPPTPPPKGVLRIDWTTWGTISLDGTLIGKTPFNQELEPGEYQVTLEVSANGGRFVARALVRSGQVTKCREAGGKLVCRGPE